jgi:hypothetical protein
MTVPIPERGIERGLANDELVGLFSYYVNRRLSHQIDLKPSSGQALRHRPSRNRELERAFVTLTVEKRSLSDITLICSGPVAPTG